MLAALLATRGIFIIPPVLPRGIQNVPYSVTLMVLGGVDPYIWTVTSGTLPPGISLSATSGILSGTPTVAGNYTFTVQVADTFGLAATITYTLGIWVYQNQFVAATTTFACIGLAKKAAFFTTSQAIQYQLLFSSSSMLSILDAIQAQYYLLISQQASDSPTYLNLTIANTVPLIATLNNLVQSLPVAPQNLWILQTMQTRMQNALAVMNGLLTFVP